MDAPFCSIFNNLQLSSPKSPLLPSHYSLDLGISTRNSPTPVFLFSRKQSRAPGKCLRLRELIAFRSSSPGQESSIASEEELAVVLEVDGVMIDAYRSCNRQAFNVAFQKLGLDCANWPEPVYSDLLRKGAGDEERMLILYFNRIGWPSSLPTSEKESFVKRLLREKKNAMDELLMSDTLLLRSGVKEFIDNACKEGVPVVIITAYYKSGEEVARCIVEKLGQERVSNVKTIGKKEVEESMYGQLVLGTGVSSSLEEQLVKEAKKAASAEKQRIAEKVASMLKLSVDLDTNAPESMEKTVVALRAAAEYAEVDVKKCVLVAGSQSGVAAAKMIGMPCVVMRSSMTSRGEFPYAKGVVDGFGGADLTISKLKTKLMS